MEKCELDRDDGRMLYEVEFRSGYWSMNTRSTPCPAAS